MINKFKNSGVVIGIIFNKISSIISASGVGELDSGMNAVVGVIVTLTRIIGVVMLLWGVMELGLAFKTQDPAQRANGIKGIAGGILIVFAKELVLLIAPSTASFF